MTNVRDHPLATRNVVAVNASRCKKHMCQRRTRAHPTPQMQKPRGQPSFLAKTSEAQRKTSMKRPRLFCRPRAALVKLKGCRGADKRNAFVGEVRARSRWLRVIGTIGRYTTTSFIPVFDQL